MKSRLKAQWNFSHLQPTSADGKEFVEELEAVHIHLTHQWKATLEAQHDETAHAIGQVPVGPWKTPTSEMVGEGGPIGTSITEASDF